MRLHLKQPASRRCWAESQNAGIIIHHRRCGGVPHHSRRDTSATLSGWRIAGKWFRQYYVGMNLGFPEMIFIFIMALIIFGPKKMPEIGRQIGRALNEFKRASNEFKAQIETEIAQLDVEPRQEILPPVHAPAGSVAAGSSADSVPPQTWVPAENHPADSTSKVESSSEVQRALDYTGDSTTGYPTADSVAKAPDA